MFEAHDVDEVLARAPHGDHYKRLGIEPIEYIEQNNLPFHEGNVVKYITRWRDKGGIADLEKVKWYVDRIIQLETKSKPEPGMEVLNPGFSTITTAQKKEPGEARDILS